MGSRLSVCFIFLFFTFLPSSSLSLATPSVHRSQLTAISSRQIDIIYKELLHLKALSHLSTMVKRELASVFVFESRPRACTVLFNQGNEGTSWYIILQGSVNVVIHNRVRE